jgi:hypothetical protein
VKDVTRNIWIIKSKKTIGDNMSYSEIVYKVPGKNHGPEGKTYDWKAVNSKAELNQAIEDGWFNTLEEAVEGCNVGRGDASPSATLDIHSDNDERERARNDDGTYVGDDLSTPDVNEAYTSNAPPSREEITGKAIDLGIQFKKNISSKKLLVLIEGKLESEKE